MSGFWWKDLLDRNSTWQGLEVHSHVDPAAIAVMDMRSGHHGRMALYSHNVPLFWASMLKDHSGIWLVFNADHPQSEGLLPAVTSRDIAAICRSEPLVWTSEWCRYFARHLFAPALPLVPAGRWVLRPVFPVTPTAPYALDRRLPVDQWHFHSPASAGNIDVNWVFSGENFPNMAMPERVTCVDWWWGGHLLLCRYPIQQDASRLKWWRKKCREGTLPPILVWYIAGFASFVILDGHYRLQAAMDEGIPPQFLVLSELREQTFAPDHEHQSRVWKALEIQQSNNRDASVEGINQTLINMYDTRRLYASSHSRAVLGEGTSWALQVGDYLRKHQVQNVLEKILGRVV